MVGVASSVINTEDTSFGADADLQVAATVTSRTDKNM